MYASDSVTGFSSPLGGVDGYGATRWSLGTATPPIRDVPTRRPAVKATPTQGRRRRSSATSPRPPDATAATSPSIVKLAERLGRLVHGRRQRFRRRRTRRRAGQDGSTSRARRPTEYRAFLKGKQDAFTERALSKVKGSKVTGRYDLVLNAVSRSSPSRTTSRRSPSCPASRPSTRTSSSKLDTDTTPEFIGATDRLGEPRRPGEAPARA